MKRNKKNEEENFEKEKSAKGVSRTKKTANFETETSVESSSPTNVTGRRKKTQKNENLELVFFLRAPMIKRETALNLLYDIQATPCFHSHMNSSEKV